MSPFSRGRIERVNALKFPTCSLEETHRRIDAMLHDLEELVGVEWFADGGKAKWQRGARRRRQETDRHRAQARRFADHQRQLQAVADGHRDVGQDKRRNRDGQRSQGLLAVLDGNHAVAVHHEQVVDCIADVGVVVDHEDEVAHVRSISTLRATPDGSKPARLCEASCLARETVDQRAKKADGRPAMLTLPDCSMRRTAARSCRHAGESASEKCTTIPSARDPRMRESIMRGKSGSSRSTISTFIGAPYANRSGSSMRALTAERSSKRPLNQAPPGQRTRTRGRNGKRGRSRAPGKNPRDISVYSTPRSAVAQANSGPRPSGT